VTFSAAAWLVVLFAVFAANLPFVTSGCSSSARCADPGARLAPGRTGRAVRRDPGRQFAIEARLAIQRQGWEFYVAMASLFLTPAFPGFVWRYLRRGA
jgi:hypothetical protein